MGVAMALSAALYGLGGSTWDRALLLSSLVTSA